MQGLSGRAYARHQGVAAATVQDWRAKGWLVLFDDGSINGDASDARVAEYREAVQDAASPLAVARQRKLAAQVAAMEDEVAAIKAQLLDPADAARARIEGMRYVVRELLTIAATAAPLVAGQPAAVAKERLTDVVHGVMARLACTTYVPGGPAEDPAAAGEVEDDLAARKTALAAERLELRRAVRRGEVLDMAEHIRDLQSKLGTARARLLGLPMKLAPCCGALDAASVEDEIRVAIRREVVAELAGPLPGVGNLKLAELLAAVEARGAASLFQEEEKTDDARGN